MHSLHSGKNAFRMHSLLKPRTKTKNQEPRFPQDSWANLGSNQNQEPRTKIPPGLLSKSWFLVLGFGSNQDLLRSPGGILVLGSWFWFLVLRLKSKIPKRLDKECILNAFLQPRTKIPQRLLSKSWFLVLGFKSKIPQRLLSKSWFLALGFKSTIPQRLLSKSWFLVLNLRFPKDSWANLRS